MNCHPLIQGRYFGFYEHLHSLLTEALPRFVMSVLYHQKRYTACSVPLFAHGQIALTLRVLAKYLRNKVWHII